MTLAQKLSKLTVKLCPHPDHPGWGGTYRATRRDNGAEVWCGSRLDDLYRFLAPRCYQAGGTPYAALLGKRI